MDSSKPVSHIRSGLLIAAALILFQVALNFSGQFANQTLQTLSYLPLVAGIVYFTGAFANQEQRKFSTLFGFGFKTLSIVIIFVVIYTAIFYSAFPQYKDKMLEAYRRMLEAGSAGINDESTDKNINELDKHFVQLQVTKVLFTHLMIGTGAALVSALLFNKRPKS
jgi:hypothetical protein